MIHPSAWKRFSGTLSQLIKCLPTKGGFTRAYLYAPPQHVVPSHAASRTSEGILWPLEGRFMHDHESELRRIPLPRLYEKSSNTGEPPRHEADHGSVHERLAARTRS